MKISLKKAIQILVLLSPACMISPAWAQCSPLSPVHSTVELHSKLSKALACYGQAEDLDPLIKRIQDSKSSLKEDESFTTEQATSYVNAIRKQYEARVANNSKPPEKPIADEISARLGLLTEAGRINPGILAQPDQWSVRSHSQGKWGRLDAVATLPPLKAVTLSDAYDSLCQNSYESEACQNALQRTAESIRAIYATRDVLLKLTASVTAQWTNDVALTNKQWHSFFSDTLPQYPWEAWATSKEYEVKLGLAPALRPPPTSQWILGHFDVAMEYAGGAPDGDHFKPAILLEAAGRNWLKWDDETGKVRQALGLSIGLLYTDRAGVADTGAALTAHINSKYSFGISLHGHEDWGLFVNIPLSEKVSESYDDLSSRYGKVRGLSK